MFYNCFFKRLFDFLISLFALIILSPVIILVIIILTLITRGNPFFIQLRPGKNSKIFKIVKFSTMNNITNCNGGLLSDEKRITPLGRIVRRSSLDEIPQLFNVIKGDMSLIGPRPLLVDYLPRYSEFQKRRHEVRPGITGWAQVNGRNAISWEQKFELDVWYVDHISLSVDLKIFWLTIRKVVKSEGITQAGQATMKRFMGTPEVKH